jgi:SAM-dependent methyltransferase
MALVPGFLKNLFGGGVSRDEVALDAPAERIPRRSTGFSEFIRNLNSPEGQAVLDLGSTSPSNINFIVGLGHRVYNEDVLRASTDKSFHLPPAEDGKPQFDFEKFLDENLKFEPKTFDAVLAWDTPDYLPEPLVKPLIERVAAVMKPGGVLLGFFHTKDAGPNAPHFRYHIAGKDSLELQTGQKFRLQRVFNNRHIENLFRDFGSIKFFLGKDNIREVIVIR